MNKKKIIVQVKRMDRKHYSVKDKSGKIDLVQPANQTNNLPDMSYWMAFIIRKQRTEMGRVITTQDIKYYKQVSEAEFQVEKTKCCKAPTVRQISITDEDSIRCSRCWKEIRKEKKLTNGSTIKIIYLDEARDAGMS